MLVAVTSVLLLVGTGLSLAAGTVVAHRRARLAADLAALARATEVRRGDDGCAAAERIAVATRRSCGRAGPSEATWWWR